MAGSSPHQTSPYQAESANIRQQDKFLNLERERDGLLANGLTDNKDLKDEQTQKNTDKA